MINKILMCCMLIAATGYANHCQPPCFSEAQSTCFSEVKESWPKIQNCSDYNLFAFGEFIEWRYSSPNLDYGRDGVGIDLPRRGESFYPKFQYKPGFKLGAGIKFGENKSFDIVVMNTWLYSNPSSSYSNFSGSFAPINYFNSPTAGPNIFSNASMKLALHFDWIEAQSGYSFNINRYLSLRPYIALHAIIVNAKLNVQYDYFNGIASQISKTHGTCDSWSIGPRVGLDTIYHITDNIGIYSNISWTQQASDLHLTTKQTLFNPDGSTSVIQNGNLHEYRNVPIFSLELGPTWDQWFCNNAYRVQLKATWFVGTLPTGANLSFLNDNNADIVVNSEFRGVNIRATFEF